MFASTCKQVKFLYEAFSRLRPGCPLRCLHGGMKHLKRMAVFYDFSEVRPLLKWRVTILRAVLHPGVQHTLLVSWPVQCFSVNSIVRWCWPARSSGLDRMFMQKFFMLECNLRCRRRQAWSCWPQTWLPGAWTLPSLDWVFQMDCPEDVRGLHPPSRAHCALRLRYASSILCLALQPSPSQATMHQSRLAAFHVLHTLVICSLQQGASSLHGRCPVPRACFLS